MTDNSGDFKLNGTASFGKTIVNSVSGWVSRFVDDLADTLGDDNPNRSIKIDLTGNNGQQNGKGNGRR